MLFDQETLANTEIYTARCKEIEASQALWETYVSQFDAFVVDKVQDFVDSLANYSRDMVFNPWKDYDPRYEVSSEAPRWRRQNLMAYLLPRIGRAHHMIVAEAVGYQGGHFTGIAITCERMLLGLHHGVTAEAVCAIPLWRTSNPASEYIPNTTQREKGFNEPTDTVVWGAIVENGLDPMDSLLWNIFPFHPHKSKNALTNRTPKEEELQVGWTYMKALLGVHKTCANYYGLDCDVLPGTESNPVMAVGRKCAGVLESFQVPSFALRHPANGGATEYRRNFLVALKKQSHIVD